MGAETAKLEASVSGRLEQRARREESTRYEVRQKILESGGGAHSK